MSEKKPLGLPLAGTLLALLVAAFMMILFHWFARPIDRELSFDAQGCASLLVARSDESGSVQHIRFGVSDGGSPPVLTGTECSRSLGDVWIDCTVQVMAAERTWARPHLRVCDRGLANRRARVRLPKPTVIDVLKHVLSSPGTGIPFVLLILASSVGVVWASRQMNAYRTGAGTDTRDRLAWTVILGFYLVGMWSLSAENAFVSFSSLITIAVTICCLIAGFSRGSTRARGTYVILSIVGGWLALIQVLHGYV
jgi:hypothetical protein